MYVDHTTRILHKILLFMSSARGSWKVIQTLAKNEESSENATRANRQRQLKLFI